MEQIIYNTVQYNTTQSNPKQYSTVTKRALKVLFCNKPINYCIL